MEGDWRGKEVKAKKIIVKLSLGHCLYNFYNVQIGPVCSLLDLYTVSFFSLFLDKFIVAMGCFTFSSSRFIFCCFSFLPSAFLKTATCEWPCPHSFS